MIITRLPAELKIGICKYLDQKSLVSLSLSSQLLRDELTELRWQKQPDKIFQSWAYAGNTGYMRSFLDQVTDKPAFLACLERNLEDAMHLATIYGHLDILNLLINAPVTDSLYHRAQAIPVEILLAKVADREWDMIPIKYVKHRDIRQLLLGENTTYVLTHLLQHLAIAKERSLDDVKKLLQHKSFESSENWFGQRLVRTAASVNTPGIIKYLLSRKYSTDVESFLTAVLKKRFDTADALDCDIILPDEQYDGVADVAIEHFCLGEEKGIKAFLAWKDRKSTGRTSVYIKAFSCCVHRGARRSPRFRHKKCKSCCCPGHPH